MAEGPIPAGAGEIPAADGAVAMGAASWASARGLPSWDGAGFSPASVLVSAASRPGRKMEGKSPDGGADACSEAGARASFPSIGIAWRSRPPAGPVLALVVALPGEPPAGPDGMMAGVASGRSVVGKRAWDPCSVTGAAMSGRPTGPVAAPERACAAWSGSVGAGKAGTGVSPRIATGAVTGAAGAVAALAGVQSPTGTSPVSWPASRSRSAAKPVMSVVPAWARASPRSPAAGSLVVTAGRALSTAIRSFGSRPPEASGLPGLRRVEAAGDAAWRPGARQALPGRGRDRHDPGRPRLARPLRWAARSSPPGESARCRSTDPCSPPSAG